MLITTKNNSFLVETKKLKLIWFLSLLLFFLFLSLLSLVSFAATPVLAQEIRGLKETREVAYIKKAVGWHWYNEIYSEDKKEKDERDGRYEKNKFKKTAVIQMDLLRKTVREAKARAILYPTIENMKSYLILQNFVTNQAGLFTQAWKKTLLEYPELDYSILHPTQNNAQHIISAENGRKEKEAIRAFNEQYGLFFFYRGNNPLDQALAPIIYSFGRENNISLIPISVDGKLIDIFENNHVDNGQTEKLGIKHFPALILVDPKNQKVIPINYGFISDSELHRRFLQVATEFKEGA